METQGVRSVKELEQVYQAWDSTRLLEAYRDTFTDQMEETRAGGWKEVTIMYRELLRRLTEGEQDE